MLIQWMAYAVLMGVFMYAAGIAADRVASMWSSSGRFVWLGALLAATTAPAWLALRPAPVETSRQPSTASAVVSAPDVEAIVLGRQPTASSRLENLKARTVTLLARLDRYAGFAWIVATLAWLALLMRATLGLRQQRSRWRAISVDGTPVLVAPDLGPAVIGALHPRVIIPEWALSLDRESRALMLRHESEHIRARDPLVLFSATLLAALFPWNPTLWLLVRRLRLAVEIDCDRRVLGASARQREYGMLLLAVGARRATPLPLATSLAERRPFLERRIRAMTTRRPRSPYLASVAYATFVAAVTIAVAEFPRPHALGAQVPAAAPTPSPVAHSTAAVATRATANGSSRVEPATARPPAAARRGPGKEWYRAMVALHYPSVLQGDPSINLITFVLDANMNFVMSSSAYQPAKGDSARAADVAVTLMTRDSASGLMRTRVNVLTDTAGTMERARVERAAKAAAGRVMIADTIAIRAGGRGTLRPTLALGDLVDPEQINSVEVVKFPAGQIGPLPIGVIVVVLK